MKMGTLRGLASLGAQFALACSLLLITHHANAASYGPKSFYLTGSLSFDVINPNDLNNLTGGTAPLPGLIGGRVQLERGLSAPAWSHWIEVDYFTGSATATGDTGGFSQSLSYLSVLPLGVTYWFARTAFIDFGAALGAGLGLAPSYSLTTTPASGGSGTTTAYTGKLGPVFVGRIEARFWISKYFAATLATGLHMFSSTLTPPSGASVNGALTGLSLIGGLTYAVGGAKETGRTYVEVIHDRPDVPPAPNTAPTPNPD